MVELPPVLPPQDGQVPEFNSVRLRRDVRDLEKVTGELRIELESTNSLLATEMLDRCRAQDELHAAETAARKARKAMRDARHMFHLQEREILSLRRSLLALEDPSAESAPSQGIAATDSLQELRASTSTASLFERPPTHAASNSFDSSQDIGKAHSATVMKHALVQDQQLLTHEAKVWTRLKHENHKLVSVVSAVDNLTSQLHTATPRGTLLAAKLDGEFECQDRRVAKPPLIWTPRGKLVPPKRKQYASILAQKSAICTT